MLRSYGLTFLHSHSLPNLQDKLGVLIRNHTRCGQMKTLTTLAIIVIINFLFFSCSDENPIYPCLDNILNGGYWKLYNGEKLEGQCYDYINHSVWRGDDYFEYANSCIDMISIPQKCDGSPLTSSFSDPILDTFWRETVRIGIIAYK